MSTTNFIAYDLNINLIFLKLTILLFDNQILYYFIDNII
jgi:hypothetical protein